MKCPQMDPDGFKGNILNYSDDLGLRDLETSLCGMDEDKGEA